MPRLHTNFAPPCPRRAALAWVGSLALHAAVFLGFGAVFVETAWFNTALAPGDPIRDGVPTVVRWETWPLPTTAPVSETPPSVEPIVELPPTAVAPAAEPPPVEPVPEPLPSAAAPPPEPKPAVPVEALVPSAPSSDTVAQPMPPPPTASLLMSALPVVDPPPRAPTLSASSPVSQPTVLPHYRRNRPPAYPAAARREGWEGLVVLEVHLDAAGAVETLRVKDSSGHAVLDQAALKAVRVWRFHPARIAGVPVAATIEVPIRFRLE